MNPFKRDRESLLDAGYHMVPRHVFDDPSIGL
jgi:hypothetical protein